MTFIDYRDAHRTPENALDDWRAAAEKRKGREAQQERQAHAAAAAQAETNRRFNEWFDRRFDDRFDRKWTANFTDPSGSDVDTVVDAAIKDAADVLRHDMVLMARMVQEECDAKLAALEERLRRVAGELPLAKNPSRLDVASETEHRPETRRWRSLAVPRAQRQRRARRRDADAARRMGREGRLRPARRGHPRRSRVHLHPRQSRPTCSRRRRMDAVRLSRRARPARQGRSAGGSWPCGRAGPDPAADRRMDGRRRELFRPPAPERWLARAGLGPQRIVRTVTRGKGL